MSVAATIIAVLVGIVVIAASMGGLYDKCGPLCSQGLVQVQRVR